MSVELPRGPRVLTEDVAPPAPRLDFGWEEAVAPVAPPPSSRRWSAVSLAALGVAVLVLGLSAVEIVSFVMAQFVIAPPLGWLALAIAATGYGLIGWAVLRELRGLAGLAAVDRARDAFARGDFALARSEALAWAARLPTASPSVPALRQAADLPALAALLESGPLAALDRAATAAGRTAAAQAFAATAVVPSPALDAIFFGWRGVRLVREVAVIHGLRPGLAGTVALLRRCVFEAGAVAAADVAIDAATRAVISSPLVQHVAGEAATGAVAARRMLLLARTAARACRIVPAR